MQNEKHKPKIVIPIVKSSIFKLLVDMAIIFYGIIHIYRIANALKRENRETEESLYILEKLCKPKTKNS